MKQSGLMKNVDAAYKHGYMDGMDFMRQLMADFALLVLTDKFHFNRQRVMDFYADMSALHDEFAVLYSSDTKDKEYAKAVLDRKLKEKAGDQFMPWEERYT